MDVIGKLNEKNNNYNNERKIKNARFDHHPYCIVKCETAKDVAETIKICRNLGKSVRIKSGGHHHEGMCSANDVVVIDLSEMNKISKSGDGMTVNIKPGAQFKKIYEELDPDHIKEEEEKPQEKTSKATSIEEKDSSTSNESYIFPGGGCGTVNVGGFIQGGGWGMSARYAGLGCDSLQEVDLVTADGELIKANQNENSDLFWAIKGGGGGNFGIITNFKFKLIKYAKDSKSKEEVRLISVWYSLSKDNPENKFILTEALSTYLKELPKFSNEVSSFARVTTYSSKEADALKKEAKSDSSKEKEFKPEPALEITFQCIGDKAKKEVKDFIEKLPKKGDFPKRKYSHKVSLKNAYSLLNGIAITRPIKEKGVVEEEAEVTHDQSYFALQPLDNKSDHTNSGMLSGELPRKEDGTPATTCQVGDSYPHKVSSAFPKGQEKQDLDKISKCIIDYVFPLDDLEHVATYLSIHSLGGKIKDPESAKNSSFFYRDKEFMLQFQAWWKAKDDEADGKVYMQWIADFRKHLEDNDCIEGAFINFPDYYKSGIVNYIPDPDEMDSYLRQYYGDNLKHLKKIKKKYDPDNFLNFQMSIPPE